MKNCVFCKIIKNKIKSQKIYENKEVLSILDISQKPKGHILIIPKKHYKDFFHTPKTIIQEIFKITKLIGKILLNNVKGINIVINNGKEAGQTIMHFHVHLMPRKIFNNRCVKNSKINIFNKKIINNIKKILN